MDWRKVIGDLWPDADPDDPEVRQKFGRRAFLIGTAATAAVIVAPSVLNTEPDFRIEEVKGTLEIQREGLEPERRIWQVPENLSAKECSVLFEAVKNPGPWNNRNLDLDAASRWRLKVYLDGLRRRPVA